MNIHFENNSYFFNHRKIFNENCHSIYDETLKSINDRHFGIVANHALATAFDTIITDNINSDYNDDNLGFKIVNKINKTKLINPWTPLF